MSLGLFSLLSESRFHGHSFLPSAHLPISAPPGILADFTGQQILLVVCSEVNDRAALRAQASRSLTPSGVQPHRRGLGPLSFLSWESVGARCLLSSFDVSRSWL